MPLIYIELSPELKTLVQKTGRLYRSHAPLDVLKELARDLPLITMERLAGLRLDPSTPESGIRVSVRQRSDDEYVVNDETLWFRIYLSEAMEIESERTEQKHLFRDMIEKWFQDHGIEMPNDTIFDFFPGPTYGCGVVNGKAIDW